MLSWCHQPQICDRHTQAGRNHINPQTKRPHTGVAQHEYTDVLRDFLIPQGNQLFPGTGKWDDKWQVQQDNAPPHKSAANLDFITANVPGGHFLAWPPNSPDLSPIENLWGWMDSRLYKLHKCKNIEELKDNLEHFRQTIPPSKHVVSLHNVFAGMKARMERVSELNGDYIGK